MFENNRSHVNTYILNFLSREALKKPLMAACGTLYNKLSLTSDSTD